MRRLALIGTCIVSSVCSERHEANAVAAAALASPGETGLEDARGRGLFLAYYVLSVPDQGP